MGILLYLEILVLNKHDYLLKTVTGRLEFRYFSAVHFPRLVFLPLRGTNDGEQSDLAAGKAA